MVSKQNPTVEDSEEYIELLQIAEGLEAHLAKVVKLIKQFHYGPVNVDYINQVAKYVEEKGL